MNSQNKKKRIKRTDEELRLEALKYNSRADFQKGSHDHWKAAWRRGKNFFGSVCSHMPLLWEEKWKTIEEVHKEALGYSNRTAFWQGSSGAYDKAQRMGWLDTVCAFMGEKSNEAYTYNELKSIALNYNKKEDFRKNDCGAFTAAHKMGIISDICPHMNIFWEKKWPTFEAIHAEALKYNRRGEFKKKSAGAWDAACRLGVLEQVCSHMKKSHSISLKEQELGFIIRAIFSTAKTLKSKTTIQGRPYIKRFDIDIFIPELNKGIEFDGTYHHSFERMRKCKQKKSWSDDDIRNYHEIKDSWFASKGIQILHIKEEDWDLNKEICIERCLNFLGGANVRKTA